MEKGELTMTDFADLEARIKHSENVEEIKQLKYKYHRCLDPFI